MTPSERKQKIEDLRAEHKDTLDKFPDALYIPKMAYRPTGKDELYISFFPSELQKGKDIFTEFVSIEYNSEDNLRTLYKYKNNPHWKEEYELVTSSSGFERHLVPVSELQVINDLNTRSSKQEPIKEFSLPDPDRRDEPIIVVLNRIAIALESIAKSTNK